MERITLTSRAPRGAIVRGVDGKLELVRHLASAEFRRLVAASRLLHQSAEMHQLIEYVRAAQGDLMHEIGALRDHSEFPTIAIRGPVRATIGYLACVRLYLDQTQRRLKQFDRDLAGRFDRAVSTAFDRSFEFRFLLRFRNYVQHRGLPYGQIRSVCVAAATESSPERFRTAFVCSPKRLMADYDGWGPVRKDLLNRRQPIHIATVVQRAGLQLEALENFVSLLMAPLMADAVGSLDEILPGDWHGGKYQYMDLASLSKYRDRPRRARIHYLPPVRLVMLTPDSELQ